MMGRLFQHHSTAVTTVLVLALALLVPTTTGSSSGSTTTVRLAELGKLVSRYESLHLRPRMRRSGAGEGAVHMQFHAFDR